MVDSPWIVHLPGVVALLHTRLCRYKGTEVALRRETGALLLEGDREIESHLLE